MSKRENNDNARRTAAGRRGLIEERTRLLALPVTERVCACIYDIEYLKEAGEWYLRIYIDKPGGVNIGDCETVSRALSDALDCEDFIEEAYTLEVSSPGLGRILKKDKHLQMSIGEEVDVKTYKPINGTKEFCGILEAFDKKCIIISNEGGKQRFERADIAVVRLAFRV